MERKRIFIGTVDKALRFLRVTEDLNASIYLVDENLFLDAGALLAVLSLNLEKPWKIEIKGNNDDCETAVHALKDYILE